MGRGRDRKPKRVHMPQNAVLVYINKYQASHGKNPRGRGLWAFEIGGKTNFFRGTYTEAKGKAVRFAANKGIRKVYVLP